MEITPLALTRAGGRVTGEGKLESDENAMFRHKDLHGTDDSEEDPLEAEAKRRKLTYVRLDGSIGVIGNGAGLVMNTLDLVQREGGRAANFLDIGGGAKAEVVHSALELLAGDPHVKGILISIFGGITRGDEVAHGIIAASRAPTLWPMRGGRPARMSLASSCRRPSPPTPSWRRPPPASA